MAGTYGMRAVPLGPSCDLVGAGKAGMDGLWLAIPVYWNMARKGLSAERGERSGPLALSLDLRPRWPLLYIGPWHVVRPS